MRQKEILIGVSASIAGYKILDLIRLLRKKKINVRVAMTEKAALMFSPSLFEKISGNKVQINLFEQKKDYRKILENRQVEHIKIANEASLIVVAPATANILSKLSCGIADNFLTTAVLAAPLPILLCPAMNSNMWRNPIIQDNVEKLRRYGFHFLFPEKGQLACGVEGVGRLVDVKIIFQEIINLLQKREKLAGQKILITAGATREPIDQIRFITNKSSGKMGIALAEECFLRGADVFLLRAESAIKPRYSLAEETFNTGNDLEFLLKKNLKNYNILFHTAAVADFIPQKIVSGKIASSRIKELTLRPGVKLINMVKSWNPKIKLIGFKAEYQQTEKELIRRSLQKLKECNADYFVANDVGREGIGFSFEENEVYLISLKGLITKIKKAPKKEIARKILDACNL